MWNTFFGLLIAVICMGAHLVIHGMAKKQKAQYGTGNNEARELADSAEGRRVICPGS